MRNMYSLLASSTAAIVLGAATGAALYFVRKAYKKKSPLHVETTEFPKEPEQPEAAEVNPVDGEEIAAAVEKTEEKAGVAPDAEAATEEAVPTEQPKEEAPQDPKEEPKEEDKEKVKTAPVPEEKVSEEIKPTEETK